MGTGMSLPCQSPMVNTTLINRELLVVACTLAFGLKCAGNHLDLK